MDREITSRPWEKGERASEKLREAFRSSNDTQEHKPAKRPTKLQLNLNPPGLGSPTQSAGNDNQETLTGSAEARREALRNKQGRRHAELKAQHEQRTEDQCQIIDRPIDEAIEKSPHLTDLLEKQRDDLWDEFHESLESEIDKNWARCLREDKALEASISKAFERGSVPTVSHDLGRGGHGR